MSCSYSSGTSFRRKERLEIKNYVGTNMEVYRMFRRPLCHGSYTYWKNLLRGGGWGIKIGRSCFWSLWIDERLYSLADDVKRQTERERERERERDGIFSSTSLHLRFLCHCVCVCVCVRLFGKLRRRWVDNVKMGLKKERSCAPAAVRVGRSDGLLLSR